MIVQTYVISISLVLLIYTQIIANLKKRPVFTSIPASMVAPQSKTRRYRISLAGIKTGYMIFPYYRAAFLLKE